MKRVYTFLTLIILVLSPLFFTGFQLIEEAEFSKEEMEIILNEVDKRVDAFIAKKDKDCHKELMEMVDNKVDSILMYDVQELLLGDDTTAIKPKPIRPEKPIILKPTDDTPLAPIIKDTSLINENVIDN